MSELLPCPFCGGEADVIDYDDECWVAHQCANGTAVETDSYETVNEAIAAWNTRAERVGERKTINKTDDFVTHDSRAERTCHNLRQHGYNYLECSSCGEKSYQGDKAFDYCPNCGAKVVGE